MISKGLYFILTFSVDITLSDYLLCRAKKDEATIFIDLISCKSGVSVI